MMLVEVMVVMPVSIAVVVVHGKGASVTERMSHARARAVEAAAGIDMRPSRIGKAPSVSNVTAPALRTAKALRTVPRSESVMAASAKKAPAASATKMCTRAAAATTSATLDEFNSGGRDRWSGCHSGRPDWVASPSVRGMKIRPLARAATATEVLFTGNLLKVWREPAGPIGSPLMDG
jgi:hypothetical protein